MYAKLAISNAKKSIKDYLIYFITITICVSFFYAFTSLSSSSYELITEDTFMFDKIQMILKYSTYVITGILILLVGYVNKYMIRRRQREFATYILLGAEQKSVAFMFFIETLIIGILAIIAGIAIGTLFSQVVTAIVFITAQQEVVFNIRLYMDTVAITFIFFISMFSIIGLYNIVVLRKLKLINMMNAHKQVEFQFKRSSKIYGLVFLISVILYSVCGYCTFSLIKAKSDVTILIPNNLLYIVISLVTFIIGTYALYYSISYVLIYIKDKCENLKYEGTNLFLIGGIVSKIKTSPMLMATISITFLGASVAFMLTLAMSQWSLGYLEYRVPYDINVRNEYSYGFKEEYSLNDINDIPKLDYSEVVDYLNDNNFDVESYCKVEKYFINEEDFYIRDVDNVPVVAVKLSDFNKLRSMLGYKEITLKENEFTTQWEARIEESIRNQYIEENQYIEINGKRLNLSATPSYDDSIGEGIYNVYSDCILILPDEACEGLTLASTDFMAQTNNKVSYEEAEKFEYEYIRDWFRKNNEELVKKYSGEDDITFALMEARVKSAETSEILTFTLGMRILGIYLGTVLIMISLTVLALQQLADSIEHKERFIVLKKLGVEEKEINKIILKQVSLYFVMPIAIALVGFVAIIYNFYLMYESLISTYIGDSAFVFIIIVGMILMISIYVCYFVGTYYTFKRNIRN